MYKYHNEINLIKEIILNEFAYNAYTYKQTKNMLKLISNSNKELKKLFIKDITTFKIFSWEKTIQYSIHHFIYHSNIPKTLYSLV